MPAHVLTSDDLEPLRRELAELRALLQVRPVGDTLTTAQAAAVAGVKPKTVRGWVESGALPATRHRRRLRIARRDLEAYLTGTPPKGAALLSSLTSQAR